MSFADTYAARVDAVIVQRTHLRAHNYLGISLVICLPTIRRA